MRRVNILINHSNLSSFIDFMVNRGNTGAAPILLIHNFKTFGNFNNIDLLSVLLKYKRGYNCGMGSRVRKRYFAEVSLILKMNDETGIRYAQRESKQTVAYHESIYYKEIKTLVHTVSTEEGFEVLENEKYNKEIDVDYKKVFKKIEESDYVIKRDKERAKINAEMKKLEKEITERPKVIKKLAGICISKESNVKIMKELKEITDIVNVKKEDIFRPKDILYIEKVKQTRAELHEVLEKRFREGPWDIKDYTDVKPRLLSEYKPNFKRSLAVLEKITNLIYNYTNPSQELLTESKNLEDRIKIVRKKYIGKAEAASELRQKLKSSLGRDRRYSMSEQRELEPMYVVEETSKEMKPYIRKFLDICNKNEEYIPIMLDAKVKLIMSRVMYEMFLDTKKSYEEMEKKYEEERQGTFDKDKKEKLLGKIFGGMTSKSDIKNEKEKAKRFFDKYEELKKDGQECVATFDDEEYWSKPVNFNLLRSYYKHGEFDTIADNSFIGERNVLEVRESSKELLESVKEIRNNIKTLTTMDEELRNDINKLFMKEVERWEKIKLVEKNFKNLNLKRGLNPSYQLMRYDIMERRRSYLHSCGRDIVTFDNLCFTEEEKEEAQDLIKQLKEGRKSYYYGINFLRNSYERPNEKDKEDYERSRPTLKGLTGEKWYKEYDRLEKDRIEPKVIEFSLKSARFKELFGVSPYGFIIGDEGDNNKITRECVIPNDSCTDYLQELFTSLSIKKPEDRKWSDIIKDSIKVRGYQGRFLNYENAKKDMVLRDENLRKEINLEKQRLQMAHMDSKEMVYDFLTKNENNIYMRDIHEHLSVKEKVWVSSKERKETNSKKDSEVVLKRGVVITSGRKMENEWETIKRKRCVKGRIAGEIKDMKNSGQIRIENKYDSLIDEITEVSDEIVDNMFENPITLYKLTDNPKRTEYKRGKEDVVLKAIKDGANPKEILDIKNKFSIANNSNANKNYNVTEVISYLKIILALKMMRAVVNKKVYNRFGFKKCQSTYMLRSLEKFIKEKIESNKKKFYNYGEEKKRKGKTKISEPQKGILKRGFL